MLCFHLLLLSNVSDSVCNLESGMCTWSNTQNMEVDKLDWELTNQEGDKHYSTPHSDHTLGTERGECLSVFTLSFSDAVARTVTPHQEG